MLELPVFVVLSLAAWQDFKTQKVSNYYSALLLVLGLIIMVVTSSYLFSFLSFLVFLSLAYSFTYTLRWGKADIYIFSALGLCLPGLGLAFPFLFCYSLAFIPYILAYNLCKKKDLFSIVPFVPCFALSFVLAVVVYTH